VDSPDLTRKFIGTIAEIKHVTLVSEVGWISTKEIWTHNG
jgi:hypothetical protein